MQVVSWLPSPPTLTPRPGPHLAWSWQARQSAASLNLPLGQAAQVGALAAVPLAVTPEPGGQVGQAAQGSLFHVLVPLYRPGGQAPQTRFVLDVIAARVPNPTSQGSPERHVS